MWHVSLTSYLSSNNIVPTDSCPGQPVDITGRAGLFLEGRVSPELQGVEISITERGAAEPLIAVATDEMGVYRYEDPALKSYIHLMQLRSVAHSGSILGQTCCV